MAEPLVAPARRGVFEAYGREGAREWIEATGDSMRPLIEPGAWLDVRFGAQPEGVGQIVLFPLRGSLVAHRVVARRAGALVTKGDAEAFCDPPLAPGDVLGVVEAVGPRARGPAASLGCAGRSGRSLAASSRFTGRAAAGARRLARSLPDPLRGPALLAATALGRSAGRAVATPWAWLAAASRRTARGGER